MGTAHPFEAFFSVPSVEQPLVSPDGTRVAYLHDDTGRPELHVVDASSGETLRLTDGHLRGHAFRSDFRWLPDGNGLYVAVVPEDDWHQAELRRFDLDGARRHLHDLSGHSSLNSVHPRGESLLFAARPANSERMPLRRLDLESGEAVVFDDCDGVRGAAYSPDGEFACVDVTTESSTLRNYVLEESSADTDLRELSAGDEETGVIGWLDDRRAIYTVGGDGATAAVRDVVADTITYYESGAGQGRPVTTLDGRVVCRERSALVLWDLERDESERIELDRSVVDVNGAGGRVGVVLEATDDRPSGLATWTADEGVRMHVQPEYGAVTPTDYVERDEVTVEAEHGEYPVHVYRTDGEPAPVIAWVYGLTPGPSDHDVFQPAIQALVSRGYTVAFPGSGAEPSPQVTEDDVTYAYSDAEHEDIAAVGRWLDAREWVDGTIVLGHSHGGYDAAMQAVRYPDPWDAAVVWDGPTDLEAHYGANGRPPLYRRCLGTLEENESEWREQSPVAHARGLGTPLLVYHGASDHHVPVEQARSLRDRLRAWGHERGVDFEYVEASGEGHMTRAAEHDVRRWRRVLAFLDRRL